MIAEDHDNGKDTQNLDLIGEIEVKVFQMLKDGPPIPFVPHAADARGVERLSEKKIKGRSISHGTMWVFGTHMSKPYLLVLIFILGMRRQKRQPNIHMLRQFMRKEKISRWPFLNFYISQKVFNIIANLIKFTNLVTIISRSSSYACHPTYSIPRSSFSFRA